jgi:hypothetical protein
MRPGSGWAIRGENQKGDHEIQCVRQFRLEDDLQLGTKESGDSGVFPENVVSNILTCFNALSRERFLRSGQRMNKAKG